MYPGSVSVLLQHCANNDMALVLLEVDVGPLFQLLVPVDVVVSSLEPAPFGTSIVAFCKMLVREIQEPVDCGSWCIRVRNHSMDSRVVYSAAIQMAALFNKIEELLHSSGLHELQVGNEEVVVESTLICIPVMIWIVLRKLVEVLPESHRGLHFVAAQSIPILIIVQFHVFVHVVLDI